MRCRVGGLTCCIQAEEEEEEDVRAAKDQIRVMKQRQFYQLAYRQSITNRMLRGCLIYT